MKTCLSTTDLLVIIIFIHTTNSRNALLVQITTQEFIFELMRNNLILEILTKQTIQNISTHTRTHMRINMWVVHMSSLHNLNSIDLISLEFILFYLKIASIQKAIWLPFDPWQREDYYYLYKCHFCTTAHCIHGEFFQFFNLSFCIT